MTINEQIKILDDKIRSNIAQYDLDRQNTKRSALSSGELDKYEYSTGEDLGYKPDVVQKAKFEYSPLGQVFNKGLNASEKKEGLLKRLKNIESKNEQQLDFIGKISAENTKPFYERQNNILMNLSKRVVEEDEENEDKELNFKEAITDGKTYNFNRYNRLSKFASGLYKNRLSFSEVKDEQKNVKSN